MNKIDWTAVKIDENDLDLIYNRLLEKETPMTANQLAETIIDNRIKEYQKNSDQIEKKTDIFYRPQNDYAVGDQIEFPMNGNKRGTVQSVRPGVNPAIDSFSVISVLFDDGEQKEFAAGLHHHKLNSYNYDDPDENMVNPKYVFKKFGRSISRQITELLTRNSDLVRIASFWFPLALLTDINPGYLNLAEAVLEMAEGNPLTTEEILKELDYPMDSNSELTVFSFNFAMQNDPRFAEVGPVGVILWTLKEMQPEDVRKVPMTLKYSEILSASELSDFEEELTRTFSNMQDELDAVQLKEPADTPDSCNVCISYPHWKAGTLPLVGALRTIFPTANETDNVIFSFRDHKSGEKFQGWVILSKNYVCGLKQWYRSNGIIPGSIFRVSKTDDSGTIDLDLIQPRASRDWIRTFQLDPKNHFSFSTSQHKVTTDFDERLAIYVENMPQLDVFWESNNRKEANIVKQIELVFRELKQDNPQGIIHFLEVYAGINMLRRVPPQVLYKILLNEESIEQIDKMYFKMMEKDAD